jgi:hypothetical protein
MHTRNHLAGFAIALFGVVALISACQSPDSSVLTEAERSIEPAAVPTADEIFALIDDLIGDPVIERSTESQFANIVKSKSEADRVRRAKSLFDYLTQHYLGGKWVDEGPPPGVKTAELFLAIGQYVGLYPEGDGTGAMCQPGDDCEAIPATGETTIPGSVITQPFTLIMTEVECDPAFGPNVVPPCYEITTYPEGIDFQATAGSSLSLSDLDSPFVTLCSDFPQTYEVGTEVFMWHYHDGVLEPMLESVEVVTFCDQGPGDEISSRWANPLFAMFKPVLTILSPQPLYAGGRGVGVGTAISDFSQVASCLPGCLPTTTSLSIEGGPFYSGQTFTLEVQVDPAPDGGKVLFYATNPVLVGAPRQDVVEGVATQTYTCDSDRVPVGSHTAQAQYMGTDLYGGSLSGTLAYECLAGQAP